MSWFHLVLRLLQVVNYAMFVVDTREGTNITRFI